MFQSRAFKNFMAKLYGFGAAIVILGAMFKILHLPGAGIMLGVGLTTEAIIFFFSAFEVPHEDPDWSLVYPELAGMDGESFEEDEPAKPTSSSSKNIGHHGESVYIDFGDLIDKKNLGANTVEALGLGLRNFGDKVSAINETVDTSLNTKDLNDNIKEAALSAGSLGNSYKNVGGNLDKNNEILRSAYEEAAGVIKDKASALGVAYDNAADTVAKITEGTSSPDAYNEQIEKLSKNLASLNAVYEMELQDTNKHLKGLNSLYGGLNKTMDSMNKSLSDAEAYRDELAKLANNVASLNSVYGNVLSAMSMKGNK